MNESQMVVHDGNEDGQRAQTAEEKEEEDLNAAIAASLADGKHKLPKDKAKGKDKENDGKKGNRFSLLARSLTKKVSSSSRLPRQLTNILTIRTRNTSLPPQKSHLKKQSPKKTT